MGNASLGALRLLQRVVPVLEWISVPWHKVHIVPALPTFSHLGGLSPTQDVRLGRGSQLRVAALTPKPPVMLSQGLDLAKGSARPVDFDPF